MLQKLDNELLYLSLSYELKDINLNSSSDKLSFHVNLGGDRSLLMEINMLWFLNDGMDSRAVAVYDPAKPGYLEMEVEVEGRENPSVVMEKMKRIIDTRLV